MPQSHPHKSSFIQEDNSKFILIGEDDFDDEEFLTEIFSSIDESFTLKFINNGKKIISYLHDLKDHHLPCLILLDYNMPEMNGADILRELKTSSRYDTIPKVIWSTSKSNMYKDICLELGAIEYVVKPSNVNDLMDVVRHMLSFCKI